MSGTSDSQQPEYYPNTAHVVFPQVNRFPGQGGDSDLMNSLWLALNGLRALQHVPTENPMALEIVGYDSHGQPLDEPLGALLHHCLGRNLRRAEQPAVSVRPGCTRVLRINRLHHGRQPDIHANSRQPKR